MSNSLKISVHNLFIANISIRYPPPLKRTEKTLVFLCFQGGTKLEHPPEIG